MKVRNYWVIAVGISMLSANSIAGPVSGPVNVKIMRPYVSGGVYVEVDSTELCSTSVFLIRHDAGGRKEMYAAVLTALIAPRKIRLEATACGGWGTELQSVYLDAE